MEHLLPILTIDKAACLNYLMNRQTPDGGFCFYRAYGVEESNGKDTYSAVASFIVLQMPIPDRETLLVWLRSQQSDRGGYANLSMAWFVLESLRLLGAQPLQAPIDFLQAEHDRILAADWRVKTMEWSALLHRLSRLAILMKRLGLIASASFRTKVSALLDSLRGNQGGYGIPAENLLDTHRVVLICEHLGLERTAGILAFAKRCVDDAFGFRLVPAGSTNSLAVIHAGVGLFDLYGATLPREIIASILRYVSSCQTSIGGFGRAPGAIATLEDTWLALACLRCLRS